MVTSAPRIGTCKSKVNKIRPNAKLKYGLISFLNIVFDINEPTIKAVKIFAKYNNIKYTAPKIKANGKNNKLKSTKKGNNHSFARKSL